MHAPIEHKILVVDDCSSSRGFLTAVLTRRLGFCSVTSVAGFPDLLSLLRQDPAWGMIALDLALPDLGLREDAHGLRKILSQTPVVGIAPTFDRATSLLALEAGFHGLIPTDLDEDKLVEAFEWVLSGHVYLPDSIMDQSPAIVARSTSAHGLSRPALTVRQMQILQRLVAGKSNKTIGRELGISDNTVKVHLTSAFRQLGIRKRGDAASVLRRWVGLDRAT